MPGCQHCLAYGKPGWVPVILPRPRAEEETALPRDYRPPPPVIWLRCEWCTPRP